MVSQGDTPVPSGSVLTIGKPDAEAAPPGNLDVASSSTLTEPSVGHADGGPGEGLMLLAAVSGDAADRRPPAQLSRGKRRSAPSPASASGEVPHYIAEPSGPRPLHSVRSLDMYAHWNGRWYPVTILRNATTKESGQWMYDIRFDGYTAPEKDPYRHMTSYPEAWIWHREHVPEEEIVSWARAPHVVRGPRTSTKNDTSHSPLECPAKKSRRAGRKELLKDGAESPRLPPSQTSDKSGQAPAVIKPPQVNPATETKSPSETSRTAACVIKVEEAPHTLEEPADDVSDAPTVRRFLGPECGRKPAYHPRRRQELLALWHRVWYPVVLLQESTEKVEGQWMYLVRWLANPKARNAGDPEESEYPEGWIWDRKFVPPRQITPWARHREAVLPVMAQVACERRKAAKRARGAAESATSEASEIPAPPELTPREKALARNTLDWLPVVHPAQLDIGKEVRLCFSPISGYEYEHTSYFGQSGVVTKIQGYPPIQVRFEDGFTYWCDYQDLEIRGIRDW